MNFYLRIWSDDYKQKTKYPCVIIENNGWDDYGYKTLFQLYYCEKSYIQKEYLGDVKVLKKGSYTTVSNLPMKFRKLDEEFCSLGQSIDYYRKINSLPKKVKSLIIEGLNDVLFSDFFYSEFKDAAGFEMSLLRNREAARIVRNRSEILKDIDFKGNEVFSFKFTNLLEGADEEHVLDVDFSKKMDIPNRIVAIVGKNGTGKTAILSEMTKSMVMGNHKALSVVPNYSKIIAISYSAFDEFYKPIEEEENFNIIKNSNTFFNYIYCGLRRNNRILSLEELEENLFESIKEIRLKDRIKKWETILKELLEEKNDALLEKIKEGEATTLSSGESILVSIFTEVIANIEKESLIIIDEPEIHLHPNAMSNLMRMINSLLEEFNSYCIISTHSPMIIQEIPARHIRIFERVGNTPSVKMLEEESFGDNIGNIINNVFRISNYESNYKSILVKLFEEKTKEEISQMFSNKLTFNALTFLSTLDNLEGNQNA